MRNSNIAIDGITAVMHKQCRKSFTLDRVLYGLIKKNTRFVTSGPGMGRRVVGQPEFRGGVQHYRPVRRRSRIVGGTRIWTVRFFFTFYILLFTFFFSTLMSGSPRRDHGVPTYLRYIHRSLVCLLFAPITTTGPWPFCVCVRRRICDLLDEPGPMTSRKNSGEAMGLQLG